MQFADQSELKKSGRNFDCSKCPEAIQQKRKCKTNRMDYTEQDDASVFPIYVNQGGNLYGFCPAKAMWDEEAVRLFKYLIVSCESGSLFCDGGIESQPEWWLDFASWFMPTYDNIKWQLRFKSLFGGEGDNGNNGRPIKNQSGSRGIGSQSRLKRR